MASALQRQTIRPYGLIRDVPASVADPSYWNEAVNMRFRNNVAERQLGSLPRPDKPVVIPERLHYRLYNGSDQFLYAGNDGIGIQQSAQFDITPLGWPAPGVLEIGAHQWTDLNGIPVWTHPALKPGYHDGDVNNAVQELPGWPADWLCDVVRSFKFYLLALAVTDGSTRYDNQIRWSASANVGNLPDEWEPSATNDAGDMYFAGTPGAVVDAVPLRDALIVYKNSSTFFMEYVGDLFVFKQRKLFTTSGILTPNCAAEWRGRHFVASEGDLLIHDGNSAQSVVDKVVRREIFDDINAEYVNRSFVYHDPASHEMNFYWASRSSGGWCDRRAVWNYADDRWYLETMEPDNVSHAAVGNYTITGLGQIWDDDTQAWDLDSSQWDAGTETGVTDKTLFGMPEVMDLQQPVRGSDRNGQAVSTVLSWETKDLAVLFHDDELPRQMVEIDRLWLDVTGTSGIELEVRFGFQDQDGATVRLGEARTYTIGESAYVDINEQGRLVSFSITCDCMVDWQLRSATLDYRFVGRF